MLSIMPSSTILSAIICRVQAFLSSGAVLAAVVIMWVSILSVILLGMGGVSLFLRCSTRSRLWVVYCLRIL